MQIESVRSLKAELQEKLVQPMIARAMSEGRLGVAARSLSTDSGTQPSVALGVARGRRKDDFVLAVRVQRSALAGASLTDALRQAETLSRGEHDVRLIGRVRKRAAPWHRRRQRPLMIGSSIAHVDVTAGTLGAVCLHRPSGEPVLLSNSHVLANEGRGVAGDGVVQPGPLDGGRSGRDTVGSLLQAAPLRLGRANRIDAAIAGMQDGIEFDPETLRDLGDLAGVQATPVDVGDRVSKLGRTTGVTRGRISAIELDNVVVDFEIGALRFDNQIEIESMGDGPFSAGGDSGSLIVDRHMLAVGLLFAGSDRGGRHDTGLTFANPIGPVLRDLKLTLEPARFFA